jgi:hypothetical protein
MGIAAGQPTQGLTPMTASATIASHFEKTASEVRATYDALLTAARALGPVREEAKKTSIHLVRTTAFAGVATRRNTLNLTLKASHRVESPRIHRAEQSSANRWHIEIRLEGPDDVDPELRQWLSQAYDLAG